MLGLYLLMRTSTFLSLVALTHTPCRPRSTGRPHRNQTDLAIEGLHDILVVELGLRCDLARDHDHVVLGHGLASHIAFVGPQLGMRPARHDARDMVADLARKMVA